MTIQNLKNIIKEAFQSYFSEAIETEHLLKRLQDRIKETKILSPEEEKEIEKNIEKLKTINFPKNKSYGVLLLKLKISDTNPYYFKDEYQFGYYKVYSDDDFFKYSTGNEIWVVIRNNEIRTIMLRKSSQTKDAVKNALSLNVDGIVKNLDIFIMKNPHVIKKAVFA